MLKLFKPYGDPALERALVGGIVEVYGLEETMDRGMDSALAEADLLMGDVDVAVTDELLEAAPHVRAVVCRSIGIDFVNVEAASRRGILVLNSPTFCVTAVAEYALTAMLCMAHRLPQAVRVMREGDWAAREDLRGMELNGKTLGLIGFGRIGRELARMALGIGMTVIAYDPYCRGETGNVGMVTLRQVLEQADVVSVHSPLTPTTRGMIGKEQLSWMKRGAILINVSRGGIVEETALKSALDERLIAAAALDVLEREPTCPGDCFYQDQRDNLLLTPHAAWNTEEGYRRNQDTFLRQITCLAEGKLPGEGIVNAAIAKQWLLRWGKAE